MWWIWSFHMLIWFFDENIHVTTFFLSFEKFWFQKFLFFFFTFSHCFSWLFLLSISFDYFFSLLFLVIFSFYFFSLFFQCFFFVISFQLFLSHYFCSTTFSQIFFSITSFQLLLFNYFCSIIFAQLLIFIRVCTFEICWILIICRTRKKWLINISTKLLILIFNSMNNLIITLKT